MVSKYLPAVVVVAAVEDAVSNALESIELSTRQA